MYFRSFSLFVILVLSLSMHASTIHVLGTGSMGLTYGYYWSKAGHDVTLIGRTAIDKSKVDVTLEKDSVKGQQTVHYITASELKPQSIDILFVTTKAYDTQAAIESVKDAISPHTIIVLGQSGFGQHMPVSLLFPQNSLYLAFIKNSAVREAPFKVLNTCLGMTIFGLISGPVASDLMARLYAPEFKTVLLEDIKPYVWQKLMSSLLISELTAAYNLTTNQVTNNVEVQQIKQQLVDDYFRLTDALGFKVRESNALSLIDGFFASGLCHSSSMREDIKYGRRTESDFISGVILQKASEVGIELPAIKQLHQQIKQLEQTGYKN